MNRIFQYLILFFLFPGTFIFSKDSNICTICLKQLNKYYSIDAWNNAFHSYHENEGEYCHSCSRIISQNITNGGYVYSDGRSICSLCQASAITNSSGFHLSYQSVIEQLSLIGINSIPHNIPINLTGLNQLRNIAKDQSHSKLKGCTRNKQNYLSYQYQIYILNGLPKIEFEAVLAHELMHIWLNIKKIKLPDKYIEGFCNLGSYLVYKNDGTQFSKIHLKAMDKNPDPKYGEGYRLMKKMLLNAGWKDLIIKLNTL